MSDAQPVEIKFTSEITVDYIQHMGNDATLAASAKVLKPEAYAEYLKIHEKVSVEGLINYLMKHRHGTPFEHSGLSIYVHAPIFVWREWHRHRIGQSYNEDSARYKTLEPTFYLPPRDRAMIKVDNWKAGRPKFVRCEEDNVYQSLCQSLKEAYGVAYDHYLYNLSLNVDPGLARDCLSVGIYSSCWVTCNPRSIMAFLSLRTYDEEAKFVSYPLYEIEVAARKLEEIFKQYWPLTHKAFCECGRVAP